RGRVRLHYWVAGDSSFGQRSAKLIMVGVVIPEAIPSAAVDQESSHRAYRLTVDTVRVGSIERRLESSRLECISALAKVLLRFVPWIGGNKGDDFHALVFVFTKKLLQTRQLRVAAISRVAPKVYNDRRFLLQEALQRES